MIVEGMMLFVCAACTIRLYDGAVSKDEIRVGIRLLAIRLTISRNRPLGCPLLG